MIVPQITGTLGNNGWYRSGVGVTWNVTAPDSNVASSMGCGPSTFTTDTAGVTLTCSATTTAGLSTSASLTIKIDQTPPVTTAAATPAANSGGWNNTNVTVALTANDNLSGVDHTEYDLDGAGWTKYTAPVAVTVEGKHVLQYRSVDVAGNVEAVRQLPINIDKTPPTVACQPTPATLWPPDGKFVPVQVTVSVTDPNGSGPAGFVLVSISSNEDAIVNEDKGFAVGTASTNGSLEAKRNGGVPSRVYTLTYQGSDVAGNTTNCTATVTVPHDQGH
jgi:hypothetical protein